MAKTTKMENLSNSLLPGRWQLFPCKRRGKDLLYSNLFQVWLSYSVSWKSGKCGKFEIYDLTEKGRTQKMMTEDQIRKRDVINLYRRLQNRGHCGNCWHREHKYKCVAPKSKLYQVISWWLILMLPPSWKHLCFTTMFNSYATHPKPTGIYSYYIQSTREFHLHQYLHEYSLKCAAVHTF